MVFAILTILMGVLPFVMYTQPLYWAYTGDGKELLNEIYKTTSCYDGIKFENGQSTLYNIGVGCMIASLVFAGIMILLALVNMISKASGNAKYTVGVKLVAFFFFLTSLAAVAFIAISVAQELDVTNIADIFQSTVGYGLIVTLCGSILALIFAPRKKKVE